MASPRVAVMMPLGCPWSRATVLRLVDCGIEVHVVDFAAGAPGWFKPADAFVRAAVDEFRSRVAGVYVLQSTLSSGWHYVTLAPELHRQLRRCGADVLLTLYGGGYALIAYLSGFRPYVVYVVGSDVLCATGPKRVVARRTLNSATAIFANGGYLADRARELTGRADVTPLLIGIDLAKFDRARPPAGGPVRIVCSRAFLPVYNNEQIIRAAALLPEDVPEFELIFVSPGPLLESLRRLADTIVPARHRSRIQFLNGVTSERLMELLSRSQIYVSFSRSDGTSVALQEALASGLYPVVSDIPQNREWITPGLENGSLVALDDPAALSGVLSNLIANPAVERVAAINRRLVTERADGPRNMTLLAERLSAIASATPGRPIDAVEAKASRA